MKKIKIGILTTHGSINYGGLLQAYALKRYFINIGCECEIINYRPLVHNPQKHPLAFVFKRKQAIKKALMGLTNYSKYRKRMELIDLFREKMLMPIPSDSIGIDKLPNICCGYDVVCCGSDQLWNLNQKDNENGAYLLKFNHEDFLVMSYAVSFGDGIIKAKDKIMDSLLYIKKFDAISVRDEASKIFLEEYGIRATVTLDPTLLIDLNIWNEIVDEKPICEEPYVLVYGFENAYQSYKELILGAKKTAKLLDLKIINPVMSPGLIDDEFEPLYDVGPVEFLNLVRNSTIVCTNSFHGCIFSIIFNKPFVALFDREKEYEPRKATLLKQLNLFERAYTIDDEWDIDKIMNFNYQEAKDEIMRLRDASKQYIDNVLANIRRS